MKASDLFVKALEAEKVEYVFGIRGEENLDLLESLRRSKIKLVLTRHEQAAGFMAATYGRLTGKTGVCLATLGPGATNFVTAAAYAQLGGMPMLMVTGQKPIKSSKQGSFQIVDVVRMMEPLTKYTRSMVSIGNIPASVREAFRRAEEERPGAVHLELPEDVAHEEGDGAPIPKSFSRRPVAEEKAVARAVDAIRNAKYPLLTICAGGNRKTTTKMLHEFVDRSEEHTSELQSHLNLVCRLLLEKKKKKNISRRSRNIELLVRVRMSHFLATATSWAAPDTDQATQDTVSGVLALSESVRTHV